MRDDADIEDAIACDGDAVLRACSAYLPKQDAEDIFQETFLRYARQQTPFNDEGHRRAWLVRVAINLCKDELKSSRRADVALDGFDDPDSLEVFAQEPEQDAVADRLRVRAALGKLSPDQRAAVVFSTVEGWSVPEIAQRMGKPENTIYSLVRRGKEKLRKVLDHDGA